MDKIIIPAKPDVPVACDMTDATDTPQERLAEYRKLFEHALVTKERLDDPDSGGPPEQRGVRFTFAARPGVQERLEDLVRRESACCPFLGYQLDATGGQIVWTITNEAGETAQAILDDFFAVPDEVTESQE